MPDKNQDKQKGGVGPITAAVIGAAVGAAAVGVAGAVALANKNSRKKIEKVIDDAKGTVTDMKENVDEKVGEGQKKVRGVVAAVKDATHDIVKAAK